MYPVRLVDSLRYARAGSARATGIKKDRADPGSGPDADTGKPIGQPLTGHTGWVYSVAFSPPTASASPPTASTPWRGCGTRHRPTRRPADHRPHRRGVGRGVQPRWAAHRLRQLRQVGASVGLRQRPSRRPATITGHTDGLYSVAFSPDGHRIVFGSRDSTLRLWPTFPDPASAMCAKLTTNMSHQQWRDWVSPDIDYIKLCLALPIAPD